MSHCYNKYLLLELVGCLVKSISPTKLKAHKSNDEKVIIRDFGMEVKYVFLIFKRQRIEKFSLAHDAYDPVAEKRNVLTCQKKFDA